MLTTATAALDWVVILPVVLPLMGAALLLMIRSLDRRIHLATAVVVVAGVAALEFMLFHKVSREGPLAMTMGNWLPPFGITFAADVLSAGLALVAACLTLVILAFSAPDQDAGDGRRGSHALVLLLLAGVNGAFLTGDLFNLYVWFEVMLIASFGLLVLGGRAIELDATVKYGFINFLATTFFLVGLGLLYGLLGTLNMADVALRAGDADPGAMAAVAATLLLAFGIKAAAFPVNAWLTASYHAPPPAVSALLAGLLTKVGVYALLRTLVALLPASRDLLEPAIIAIAIATLVIAPMGAIAETNLRRALGFLVVGGIGSVLAGLAIPSVRGVEGAVFYIVHAMATMTALYLTAGLVEAATGQTDSRRMGGLYAANSLLSVMFLLLILAASGVPPLLGFWPKLLLLQAGLGEAGWAAGAITAALLVNAFLTLIAGTRLWAHIFWRSGPEGESSEESSEDIDALTSPGRRLAVGVTMVLTAAILVAGLLPNVLFGAAATASVDLIDPARYIGAVNPAGDAR